jgi:hypothetical protein
MNTGIAELGADKKVSPAVSKTKVFVGMPKHSAEKDAAEEEDVSDRFTDPVKKKKKQKAKAAKKDAEREKIALMGKQFAKDRFNEALTPEDVSALSSFVVTTVDEDEIRHEMETVKAAEIKYETSANASGMLYVFDFINGARRCQEWLDRRLLAIGWSLNRTGYYPISMSNTVDEAKNACVECFKMACKQMLLFQQAAQK